MAHADVTKAINYTFVIQNMIGSDEIVDQFFNAAVDAGIRYGQLADSGLVSLPLAADNRRIACAAPSYLERHGRPTTPAEPLSV